LQIPAEFPGIASPGQPLHSKDVVDAVFEELYHSLRICQYATATGALSFTDPEVPFQPFLHSCTPAFL